MWLIVCLMSFSGLFPLEHWTTILSLAVQCYPFKDLQLFALLSWNCNSSLREIWFLYTHSCNFFYVTLYILYLQFPCIGKFFALINSLHSALLNFVLWKVMVITVLGGQANLIIPYPNIYWPIVTLTYLFDLSSILGM